MCISYFEHENMYAPGTWYIIERGIAADSSNRSAVPWPAQLVHMAVCERLLGGQVYVGHEKMQYAVPTLTRVA